MTTTSAAALAVLLAVSSPPASAADSTSPTVHVHDFAFTPSVLTVDAVTIVVVRAAAEHKS